MSTNESDEELINLLQSGNKSALGKLYDRYSSAVYRLALRMLGNIADAEDLTQEVFLTLWQGAEKYQPQRGSLLVFLLTVTRSRALNKIRQTKSRLNLVQRIEHHTNPEFLNSPLEAVKQEELTEIINQAFTQIPTEQRQVLELSYYQGLSQSAITDHLQIPLGTVKTRSRQGLIKLRKLLQDLVHQQ